MAYTHSKKPKKPQRRRKNSDSIKVEGLTPVKENMTGETELPKKSRRKRAAKALPVKKYRPLEKFTPLELEAPLRRPPEIVEASGTIALRALFNNFLLYGLGAVTLFSVFTFTALYFRAKDRLDPVTLRGDGFRTVFQIGVAEEYCQVNIATKPISSSVEVNGQRLLQRSPVNLLLPCNRLFTVSLYEDGFVPTAQLFNAKDRLKLQLPLNVGIATFPDRLKISYLNALRPILRALGI